MIKHKKAIITIGILLKILFLSFFFIPYKHYPKTIIIPKGTSSSEIINILHENNVVRSKIHSYAMFYLYRILGKSLKSGEYEFSGKESTISAFRKIKDGKVVLHFLTIPEGLTNYEIYQIISNEPKLTGAIKASYKEGELLPETYDFVYGETKEEFIRRMNKNHNKLIAKLWEAKSPDLNIKSPQELVTLASIVEKEAKEHYERYKVASVYNNRLKVGMPLQADPTVIYAITEGKTNMGRLLTSKDLKITSPYNTYTVKGLPPTPICNPGEASLLAAANPAKTPYFYFVSNNNGGHNFATNLADHIKNVRVYRKGLK